MKRGERIAKILKDKFFSDKSEVEPTPTKTIPAVNPKGGEVNPLDLPAHVPAAGDKNDPTGTGYGSQL